MEHALSAGAAALGVALLIATAWHLLRPNVVVTPQLATSSFADRTTQPPLAVPTAAQSRARLTAPVRQHGAQTLRVHGASPARPAQRPERPFANAGQTLPKRGRPLADSKRSIVHLPQARVAFAAKPAPRQAIPPAKMGAETHRLVAVTAASLVAPKARHGSFAPPARNVRQRPSFRAAARDADRSRARVALVRKPNHRARFRHRYGSFQAPLNYNPLPALATVSAQAPPLDIAPESLPTPCTSRRHCR